MQSAITSLEWKRAEARLKNVRRAKGATVDGWVDSAGDEKGMMAPLQAELARRDKRERERGVERWESEDAPIRISKCKTRAILLKLRVHGWIRCACVRKKCS